MVEINPTGNVVQITGANAQGKSSVLDAIFAALAGAKAAPSKPVREGEDAAVVKLDLGEVKVTRKFTSDGKTTLAVEGLNGARFPSPQKMLDDLTANISFDPLAFTRMLPKAQLETLKKLVPLDVDVDALDGLNQTDYEKRTEVNREVAHLKARVDAIRIPVTNAEDLKLDEPTLMKELDQAAALNSGIERHKTSILYAQSRVAELKRKFEELQRELQTAIDDHNKLVSNTVADPIDLAVLRGKLERARNAREAKRLLDERDRLNAQLKVKVDEAATLTQTMDARLTQKHDAIKRAKMPVTGLSFGAEEVLFNGVPFSQASQAEQLVVSTVLAMASNPRLRIIRIQDGSLLDDKNLALIGKLAQKGDYQVWCETVKSDDPMAIHMEDGRVVSKEAHAGRVRNEEDRTESSTAS